MNKFFLSLVLVCLGLCTAHSQFCNYENTRFVEGETLTYQVYYQLGFIWVPAGEVVFKLQESATHYLVEVSGKTYESYNSFFEVDDYFSSSFDKSNGRPETFIRDIHEGNYTKYDSIHFDHGSRIASGAIGKTRDKAVPYALPISSCVHDIISILYAVRNLDLAELKEGYKVPFAVFFDNEEFPLTLDYNGIQKKKIKNIGKRSCYVLSPEVVAGEVFDEDSRIKIWVSNDQDQIPLLIESPVIVGSVKAVLKMDATIIPK